MFTLLLADLDEELEKGGWGGVRLGGGRKVYTLAYADDAAVVAEVEEAMKGTMGKLKRYMEGRGLQLNVEKSKMMKCRRGGGREIEGGCVEVEVKMFKYLGYTLMGSGRQEAYVEERVRKAAAVMRKVWGIGKRRFGKDWGKRVWLFDKLVWTTMSYWVEIWGWKVGETVECLHDRFLRWVLGVDWCTPGYMIREELLRDRLKGRAGLRAWGYERKLEEGQGGELPRMCWEEIKGRARRGNVLEGWEEKRKGHFEERGWTVEEVEGMRGKGKLRGVRKLINGSAQESSYTIREAQSLLKAIM